MYKRDFVHVRRRSLYRISLKKTRKHGLAHHIRDDGIRVIISPPWTNLEFHSTSLVTTTMLALAMVDHTGKPSPSFKSREEIERA